MSMIEALIQELDQESQTTRRVLERVPGDRLGWKPHDKSMSLGGLATHLSNLPNWGATILNGAGFDLADGPPNLEEKTSRADILAAFDAAAAQARGSIAKTDAELVAPWSLKRGGQHVFTMPRATAFRTFMLYHLVHHRGQLSVYLRLNDIPVPSIYGPTADER